MISKYNITMQWTLGYTGIISNKTVDKLIDYNTKNERIYFERKNEPSISSICSIV